jgi:hypothetical protein
MYIAHRTNLLLSILIALVAVCVVFLVFDVEQSIALVKYLSYWLLLFACILLAWQTVPAMAVAFRRYRWRKLSAWAAIIFIAFTSFLLLQSQPRGFKILMDEPVLATTALNLSSSNQAMVATRGYHLAGTFHLLGGYVDKRPLFFPFLVSIVHNWLGYSAANALLLNALLLPVFLVLLYYAGDKIFAKWGGYLAVCLFATVPLLPMMANSGMFDFLNLVMLLAAGLAGHSYVKSPDDGRMNRLVLLGILLAQTRYESVLYVLSVALVIFFVWFREREIRISKTLIVAPLLLITFPLQQKVIGAYESFWQLEEGMVQPFGIEHIWGNLVAAKNHFFAFESGQPNSLLLSVLCVLAIIGVLVKVIANRQKLGAWCRPGTMTVAVAFGAVAVFNTCLLMTYHWGQVNDMMVTRIVLPLVLLQVLFVTYVAAQYLETGNRTAYFIGAICLYFVLVTRPVLAQNEFLRGALANAQSNFIQEKVIEYADQQALFITNRHLIVIAERESALPLMLSGEIKERLSLHLEIGTFSSIYVFYLATTGSEDPLLDQVALIEEAFDSEILDRRKFDDSTMFIFAKVNAILGVEPTGEGYLIERPANIADFSRSLP